jgi:hypothetical protein
MTRTKWWLRIVGAFYVLLTVMNLMMLFFYPKMIADTLPASFGGNEYAIKAFADAWLVFVLELGVIGGMLLYASRNPAQSRLLVLLVVYAELFRGIVADAIWITRGYSAASYVPFIILHGIIIATGLIFMRKDRIVSKAM